MPQTARLIRPCNVLRPPPDDQRDQEPSAKLTARTNAQSALNGLFLSLGAISPLVAARRRQPFRPRSRQVPRAEHTLMACAVLLVYPPHPRREQLARALGSEGFDVDVLGQDGELQPLLTCSTNPPQAVVLHSSGDRNNTANFCRYMRNRDPRIALLIIAAPEDPNGDCVTVLEAGADDYLVAPGSDELIARIRSITRRQSERHAQHPLPKH